MTAKYGRLIAVVAAVAVGAVATGGALAYRQGPESASFTAVPLPAPSTAPTTQTSIIPASTPVPSPTPTLKPSVTSPATPRNTPASPRSHPVRVTVDLTKLSKGRAPQWPHLVGREVRGGGGSAVRIPGTGTIMSVARLGNDALAVVTKDKGTELLRVHPAKATRHTPDVKSMVSSEDGTVAYVATRTGPNGEPLPGGVVYAETSGWIKKLTVPNEEVHLVGLANGRVFYRVHLLPRSWKLYEWVPGAATAKEVTTAPSANVVSPDGELASTWVNTDAARTCTTLTALATGKRLWKSCEDLVQGFTPDGATTLTVGGYGANGPANRVRALDTKSGKVIREWEGSFGGSVAEDDQHVLIHSGGGPIEGAEGRTSAILRCDIATGGCELATELGHSTLGIGV